MVFQPENKQTASVPTVRLKHTHIHTRLPETTRVSQYQKGKTDLDFTEARDSE